MSALRSAIEELVTEDLNSVFDARLEEDVVEINRALDVLQAQLLRRTAEVDHRRSYERDGGLSTTAWLAQTCDMGSSTAREKVRVARALRRMPLVAEAFGSGDLSYSKVRMLAWAAAAHPETFSEHEPTLLDIARRLIVRDLHRAVDYWRQAQDFPQAVGEAEALHVQRRLHVSQTFEGMVRLDGWLDPEAGEVVLAEREAITTPEARASGAARAAHPERHGTASQRRADGLTELCRQWLDRGQAVTGGEKPHIPLIVDLETLQRRVGRLCELDNTGTVTAEAARRLACDAGISRIIVDGTSQPLDVGRRTRTISPAQRRALVVRDRSCRFPACDRPPPWCDGHHIEHWVDGGPTDLANFVSLCRRHHRLIHEGGFGIHVRDGKIEFTRPDGSVIEEGMDVHHAQSSDGRPGAAGYAVPVHDLGLRPGVDLTKALRLADGLTVCGGRPPHQTGWSGGRQLDG